MESTLTRPSGEKFRTYKQSHIEFCGGNFCAAGIIDLFDKIHIYILSRKQENKKDNDIAESHGDQRSHSEHLLKAITITELKNYLMGMFSERTIRASLKLLIDKGLLSVHRNPNPRYGFDKRNHYQFHPDVFNTWVKHREEHFAASNVTILPHRSGTDDRVTLADLPHDPVDFAAAIDNKDINKKNNREANLDDEITQSAQSQNEEGLVEGLFFDGVKHLNSNLEALGVIGLDLTEEQTVFLQRWGHHMGASDCYRVSNPKQLLEEVQYTLLDYTQLSGCENNFYRKLCAIDALVRSSKWTTPFKLQKKKASNSSSLKNSSTASGVGKKLSELAQKIRALQTAIASDENFVASIEAIADANESHQQAILNVNKKNQQRQTEIKTLIATKESLMSDNTENKNRDGRRF